ncbi:uncharacterized protein AMSG_12262, partial [Thecamonas trahens ATCC 50062]
MPSVHVPTLSTISSSAKSGTTLSWQNKLPRLWPLKNSPPVFNALVWYKPDGSPLDDPALNTIIQERISRKVGADDIVVVGGSPFYENNEWFVHGTKAYSFVVDWFFGAVGGHKPDPSYDPSPALKADLDALPQGPLPTLIVFEKLPQGFDNTRLNGAFSTRSSPSCGRVAAYDPVIRLFYEIVLRKAVEYGLLTEAEAQGELSDEEFAAWAAAGADPGNLRSLVGDDPTPITIARGDKVAELLGPNFVPTYQHYLNNP